VGGEKSQPRISCILILASALGRAGHLVARTVLHAGVVDLLAEGASRWVATQDGRIHRLALE